MISDFAERDPIAAVADGCRDDLADTQRNSEAVFSPFHLLSALLSRDKQFASSLSSQQQVSVSILELIDDRLATLLDRYLVWHRVSYPDIPDLPSLRAEIKAIERGNDQSPSLFLLTLLYDLALDMPSPQLAPCRTLQPAVRALLYQGGQRLLFSLAHTRYTVLGLVLAGQYRPLALTTSQSFSASALKGAPYVLLAKQVATELYYQTAGVRLTEALNQFDAKAEDLTTLMHECLHWIRLTITKDALPGAVIDTASRFRNMDQTTFECLEALHTASLLGRMPSAILYPYSILSNWGHMLTSLRELADHWKDINSLRHTIIANKAYVDQEKETFERWVEMSGSSPEHTNVLSHVAEMERHLSHASVKGSALFFAVMFGVHGASDQRVVQPEQAVEVSDHIIDQLLAHSNDDSDKSAPRRFLEEFGESRMDDLERVITNFITAADSLTLDGVPYVGQTRHLASFVLFTCKDIVEGNAARLKGWGGLHDRVDIQMILFLECARRLEGMSATGGTEEAIRKGCILTASAKLIRSLHRIMQGFKKTLALSQRRTYSENSKQQPMTANTAPELNTNGFADPAPGWEQLISDDLFSDWDNWPQFDAFDFSDLFGSGDDPQQQLYVT